MLFELLEVDKARYVFPVNSWHRESRDRLFCQHCHRVYRKRYPEPIDAWIEEMPRNLSCGRVFTTCLGLIHVALLEKLGDFMNGFVFGNCYDQKDRLLSNYRVFYHRKWIHARGQPGPKWGICEHCGELWGGWKGKPYVLSHQLDEGHVWQDGIASLFVDNWLAERIDWTPFRDIELYPFPVLDRPRDGLRLPGDPDWDALPPLSEEEQRRVRLLFDETAAAPIARRPRSTKRPKPPSPDRMREALGKFGLAPAVVEFLMQRSRPGFRLERTTRGVKPMSAIPLGGSHLGGVPDMPADWTWPAAPDERPLAFLAQIDLEDAAGLKSGDLLPVRGYLYFFYDAQEQPWGSSPQDCGSWRVLLSEARADELTRASFPQGLPDYCRFGPRRVKLSPKLFLPSAETFEIDLAGALDDPLASLRAAMGDGRYAIWSAKLNGCKESVPDHRLLGYPREEQSAMPPDFAELVQNRLERSISNPQSPGRFLNLPGRRAADWPEWARRLLGETPVDEWRLLLQLGSDDWMWGDCGKLYFWIRRSDLQERRFENVWLQLQCG